MHIPAHERHETLALEYTYRLTTELEEARERYVAEQRALERAEAAEVELIEAQLRQARERTTQLRSQFEQATRQAGSAVKKAAENDTMVSTAEERGKFEKGVADSIAGNIPLLQAELKAVEKEARARLAAANAEVDTLEAESQQLLAELSAADC